MGIEQDWDGRLQLEPQQLPERLSHLPSREFLTQEGLPEAAAFLDFSALDFSPLDPFTKDGGTGQHLFVLGETAYPAPRSHEGDAVVLDGVTGQVLLVGRRRGELRRDLLASGLPALIELMREVDVAALAAEEPDALGGDRGPAIVAEVVRVVRERLRAIDPELFAHHRAAPPHWETALLVRSLAWGALPGGPAGLAYEFGPELAEDLAAVTGNGQVRRFRPEELPGALTHGPTLRLLTDVGLPLGGALLGVADDGPLITMVEAYPEYFAPEPSAAGTGTGTDTGDVPTPDADPDDDDDDEWERDHQRHHVALAAWPHDLEIALDGATGRLELPAWNDPGMPEAYLNRDVSALLYTLWTCGRMRAEWRRWEHGAAGEAWALFDPQALLSGVVEGVLTALDPGAFASPDHSWQLLADDHAMGGLLH
ncbi:SUKH-4 family immunity protein [Kitasatospora sp. RG8]|uniref:SUKH-4 family immunity protein n=1 Tax=Kitasatospora sp. RG8 TaxID=2820815 RepID=UPI001ADFA3CB|nr:SUKH-4 family immunity protein [Kitasatospora sp. RG8]MBP0448648.1 SUKH-4 family immunity protein [Kitasatospora sp. RG8]